MGYRDDIKTDKYKLDRELIEQPQKFLDYALAWNDAADRKEKEKVRLDIVRAKVELEIREEEKFPEKMVAAKVTKHRKVKRQMRKYLQALKLERTLSDVKASFRQRKSMLEKLVDLNMMLRFCEVKDSKVPRDQQEAIYQHRSKNIRRRLKGSIKESSGDDDD